ncbi:DUF6192 family protein [Actinoplanes sp. L3-i22]|uniref:DUF6192 family protein n=1 Tax=Actinoplanes sp. L3-i22 TaxID=2836373 RepID=UPI001C860EC3
MLRRDTDASAVVKDLLRREEIAAQANADPPSRRLLHEAELDRYRQQQHHHHQQPTPGPAPRPPDPTPAARITAAETPREVLEPIGACTAFCVQVQPWCHICRQSHRSGRDGISKRGIGRFEPLGLTNAL